MAENSKIEWTDHTFNPWRGCTKVSPGCLNCYAETLSKRNPAVLGQWGSGKPRVLASDSMWSQPLKWNTEEWGQCPSCGRVQKTGWRGPKSTTCEHCPPVRHLQRYRPRVFCASLADWLDDEVPVVWLARLLVLIMRTPELDWLLLTKRPQNFRGRMNAALKCVLKATGGEPCNEADFIDGWVNKGDAIPKNIWIGTSVEDQRRADERIPLLLNIPAKVRFLSCEPLLGPVNLDFNAIDIACEHDGLGTSAVNGPIHWVICGGESGPNARPMNPDWARSLRDQCQAAGVPFFFKQWGEFVRDAEIHAKAPAADSVTVPFGDGDPTNYRRVYRVGKKLAGRLLDGREWNELPSMKGGTAQHG